MVLTTKDIHIGAKTMKLPENPGYWRLSEDQMYQKNLHLSQVLIRTDKLARNLTHPYAWVRLVGRKWQGWMQNTHHMRHRD